MNAAEYKAACRQPDTFSRFSIEETARLMPVDSRLKSQLLTILTQIPIQKPRLYKSEITYDYFKISLSVVQAAEIVAILLELEAEAINSSGETSARASSVAGLVDIWGNYIESKIN